MENAVELIRLLLKFVVLCQMDILQSFREDNVKFNFLVIIWESKMSWRVHFVIFQRA